ncbi:YgjV family protein [Pseudarthrobacter sp. NamE2]|uniref:CBU_0592 family membrane protein n=1 Tax=Pseudarthrobacter sp. NamE2 TaxID=2576838 RepID=UPI0010FD8A40|nr:YgjV family protein [Pseudarthrobacter sp. NamE2]TLM81270.1 YgjV family protein [Pseudarthrobacter sp. NamE2]
MELLWEIAGWAGAVAILSAYLAVSMGWLKAGKGSQVANLFGSVAFIINGSFHGAWPSVVTNVAWFLISAIALVRMRKTDQPVAPAGEPQVQYPGVPDTTGQLAVVEVLTGSIPAVAPRPAVASVHAVAPVHAVAEKQALAV